MFHNSRGLGPGFIVPGRNSLSGSADFPAQRRSGFHGEADFDGHLPMIQLSLVDASARFDHLEPAQVFDCFIRAFNGFINGVLDGVRRRAGEFDEFINVIFHGHMFTAVFH
jgi:hypothetical protein